MRMTDTAAQWLKRINEGHSVTDVGQLDRNTRIVLRRYTRRGHLIEDKDMAYPQPKPRWRGYNWNDPK